MSLKLVSVNIERSKHLDLVRAFIEREQPDVVCMQELMREDIGFFTSAFPDMTYLFEPMGTKPDNAPAITMGIGILTRLPVIAHETRYYVGDPETAHPPSMTSDQSTYNNFNRMVLIARMVKDDQEFCIGTTHCTWTPEGSVTDEQRRDIIALLTNIEDIDELLLTGDFNAPRTMSDGTAGEAFGMIAAKYRDNIPAPYATSIDGSLHRAGALPYMVDGLFSTPQYKVSDVVLHTGVSDHCAITATVSRAQ